MSIAVRFLRSFAFILILILCLGTLQYLNFKPDTGFLKLKQFAVKTGFYLPAFYAHIFGASTILIAGALQFSKKIQSRANWHRMLGKVYVFGVLFFAAPGAYVMTFFIHRGTGVFISFFVQNTLWVTFTLLAFLYIKDRKIEAHIMMMHRSYALAFAAVTLRFYIWVLTVFWSGVGFENNYVIIALASWIPNLIVAELINYHQRKNMPAAKGLQNYFSP
ncbi:MAG TPA: DUF2306 domain-containing protein [Mucilaginibacter sp.]|nr:DUF2306 domain-containing protein [Mucilaginibacter sp.]